MFNSKPKDTCTKFGLYTQHTPASVNMMRKSTYLDNIIKPNNFKCMLSTFVLPIAAASAVVASNINGNTNNQITQFH